MDDVIFARNELSSYPVILLSLSSKVVEILAVFRRAKSKSQMFTSVVCGRCRGSESTSGGRRRSRARYPSDDNVRRLGAESDTKFVIEASTRQSSTAQDCGEGARCSSCRRRVAVVSRHEQSANRQRWGAERETCPVDCGVGISLTRGHLPPLSPSLPPKICPVDI